MGNLIKLKIRNCPTPNAAKTIALGLVFSHLDNANALDSDMPSTELYKLQQIQNMTAKFMTGANKHDCSAELCWLPIHLQIKYKVLILVFRSLYWFTPKYLCKLIGVANPTRPGLRSEDKAYQLRVTFTKHSTLVQTPPRPRTLYVWLYPKTSKSFHT